MVVSVLVVNLAVDICWLVYGQNSGRVKRQAILFQVCRHIV